MKLKIKMVKKIIIQKMILIIMELYQMKDN